jgi:signal transduction histidine kinase
MKNRFQRRLIGLLMATVLAAVGIAWLVLKLQQEAALLGTDLKQVDSESFRIADQFRDLLRPLNDSLYHYGRSNVVPDIAAFNKASDDLDVWIDVQKPKLISSEEQAVMEQIDHVYDDYKAAAKTLLARLEKLGDASATVDEYTGVRKESARLFELGRELSRAHLAARVQVIEKTGVDTAWLRILLLISLGLLFAFALALGWVVYRDMILPLRARLVESEELRERQEKLASLGVLAAGVAHEIRNPLTAIKGVVFLQKKELPAASRQFGDAVVVEREILRLERIVNEFLQFARPGDCRLTPMTADEPLREVQSLLAPDLARQGTSLVIAEAPTLPINADAEQLQQVLINLVRNAAEAVDHNGVVKLRARLDWKPLAGKERQVAVLEVEDNGKGMSAETQKRLFDPFFTTKDTGTGLGLSIAVRIVQGHGGMLEYQTALGLGTTFGIVLPIRNSQTNASANRTSQHPDH